MRWCVGHLSMTVWCLVVICQRDCEAQNRAYTSVVALGANIICNKIPGLAPKQRTICKSRPDAIGAVGEGAILGLKECQFQFRHSRWNCSGSGLKPTIFGYMPPTGPIGSREAAYRYAINSAAVAYAITQACSEGNLTSCGCDQKKAEDKSTSSDEWRWGGCSADIKHGLRFARKFMDAQEIYGDSRSLMNVHNNRVGRKVLQDHVKKECKCHGVSASCTIRTCWMTLPDFRKVGDTIKKKYHKAKMVVPMRDGRAGVPVTLMLKRSKRAHKKPRRKVLVYLKRSPSYCETDPKLGVLGTSGRICNRTSKGTDGCDLLCCGRGYNTYPYTRYWKCNCKFKWCCKVVCEKCHERTEMYTCK